MFLYKRSNRWYIGYSEDGKQKSRPLHKYLNLKFPVTDRFTAQNLLANLRMKEIHGELGIPDDFGSLTVDEFYLRYFRYCDRNKAFNTVKSDKERLGRWIRFLKKEKVEKISQIRLTTFRDFSEQEISALTNATQNRYASIVRASFNWGIREGYLKENPLKNVTHLKEVRTPRAASFRFEDLKKLLSIEDKIFLAYLKLIYYTLMRRSEALNLKWSDVDFKRQTIQIQKTKTDHPRMVPVSDKLLPILKSLSKGREHLFCWTENQVTKKFQRLRKRFDLKIDGIHHLRHLRASELIRKGANLKAVQKLLGHTDSRMTLGVYIHVNIDDLRKAVEL